LKPILLDAGVIVAWLDTSESKHRACVDALQGISSPFVTCEAVIAESCYLLRNVTGAKEAVLENVSSGVFQIPLRLSDAASDVRRILRKYRDRDVDLADACLVHLANEFETGEILTLDSDFQVYRWGRNKTFRSLVPGV
jgi:predicted nucleic acid-binding protein